MIPAGDTSKTKSRKTRGFRTRQALYLLLLLLLLLRRNSPLTLQKLLAWNSEASKALRFGSKEATGGRSAICVPLLSKTRSTPFGHPVRMTSRRS